MPSAVEAVTNCRFALSRLHTTGWKRRAVEADMALKYCAGHPLRAVETRLTHDPELPNWDILIQPVSTS